MKVHKLILVIFVFLAGCATEKLGRINNSSRAPSAVTSFHRIELLVEGDGNCDPDRRPESLAVNLSLDAIVEGVSSGTVLDPKIFLGAPFSPTATEMEVLNSVISNPGSLKSPDSLEKYRLVAERLFVGAFSPPGHTRATAQRFGGSVVFVHTMLVNDLPAFQNWYFETLAPKTNSKFQVTTDGNLNHPILPLLLYGTVKRAGQSPNYKIVFSPSDTIITGNPQNEAHDTTLCQLRRGIFNPTAEPKADIPIRKVISIQ